VGGRLDRREEYILWTTSRLHGASGKEKEGMEPKTKADRGESSSRELIPGRKLRRLESVETTFRVRYRNFVLSETDVVLTGKKIGGIQSKGLKGTKKPLRQGQNRFPKEESLQKTKERGRGIL